jgi:hypothetical protein
MLGHDTPNLFHCFGERHYEPKFEGDTPALNVERALCRARRNCASCIRDIEML